MNVIQMSLRKRGIIGSVANFLLIYETCPAGNDLITNRSPAVDGWDASRFPSPIARWPQQAAGRNKKKQNVCKKKYRKR